VRLFVTVGNALQPFDRMLAAVDAVLARHHGAFEGVCQHGTSAVRPRGLRAVASLGREEHAREMARAEAVVTHAGVGSVQTALLSGHTPIVFARRRAHGEHVDDHQVQLVEEFTRSGRVLVAESEAELEGLLEAFLRGERPRREVVGRDRTVALSEIQEAIHKGRSSMRAGTLKRAALGLVGLAAPSLRRLLVSESAPTADRPRATQPHGR
jgi:UDP-N-acetylglucosamine transferase subunit ALG13